MSKIAVIHTFEVPQESRTTNFNKIIPDSDSMETPPALFNAISDYFGGFNVDVAAALDNTLCGLWFNEGSCCGLKIPWINLTAYKTRVWCNPPYSNITPWLEKAHEEVHIKHNAEIAVILTPFDPSTAWYKTGEKLADEIYILKGRRVRFVGRWYKPDGTLTKNSTSRQPHCLWVFKGENYENY